MSAITCAPVILGMVELVIVCGRRAANSEERVANSKETAYYSLLAIPHSPFAGNMRIVDIREAAFPVRSQMRNASFDFFEMTTSIVAVITDALRDGRPV